MHPSQLLAVVAATLTMAAPSVEKRGTIGHDKVKGFKEAVQDGAVGKARRLTIVLVLKFKPYLKVEHGCVPFPAVDADGNTGGGLKDTGSPSSKCSSSPGQVYARGEQLDKEYAIMYSWYMPKDHLGPGTGHRHDWEGIVVFLDDVKAKEPKIKGVSTSAHGKWKRDNKPPLDGSRPKIAYYLDGITHSVKTTGAKGGSQPLIDWEKMGPKAREALRNTDFGKAVCPFKDDKFKDNLKKAQ
ncbi:necrosis-and ethylene-inducing protein-like protein 1 precursor [Apiospora arundinis]